MSEEAYQTFKRVLANREKSTISIVIEAIVIFFFSIVKATQKFLLIMGLCWENLLRSTASTMRKTYHILLRIVYGIHSVLA